MFSTFSVYFNIIFVTIPLQLDDTKPRSLSAAVPNTYKHSTGTVIFLPYFLKKDGANPYLRRLEWIVWREVNINQENPARKWAISRAHDCSLPVKNVPSCRS
jgi:hypothetical protein